MPFIAIVFSVALVPIAAFLVMAAAGLANYWAAVAGIVLTLIGTGIFSLLWSRDLALLTSAVQRLQTGAPPPADTPGPTLMEPLALEIARLGRTLAARAARIEQDRLADTLILERLPDPLVVLRADQSVSRQNKVATMTFGVDLPAVLRHPALLEAFDQAMASEEPRAASLTIPAPIARELQATVVPMSPPLQDGGRAVVILSDRTRERSVERAHADFVANVSHELRTPLASLIGFTETLLGPAENDPPARKRFLGIMAEQGARMNRLIDDLLSLSRIEMAEHQTPSDPVDLRLLLPRIVAGFEPRLGKAKLEVTIAPDTRVVPGDADQIAQVLNNLLENAVKYGKEGGTVRLTAKPADGRRWPTRPGVVIEVADNGPGIPRAAIPRVTERFYRVDKGRSRAAGGTGLGLAIVKHITNRHRGQLLIESEEGLGTTISVWLPVGEAPRAG